MSNCLQRILFLPNNFMEICPNYQLKVWLWGSLYNNTCIYIVNVYLEGHGSSKFNATCFVLIGRHCCTLHFFPKTKRWGSLIIPQNALPSPSVKLTSINNLFFPKSLQSAHAFEAAGLNDKETREKLALELRKKKILNTAGTFRLHMYDLTESIAFNGLILGVILLNTGIMCALTYDTVAVRAGNAERKKQVWVSYKRNWLLLAIAHKIVSKKTYLLAIIGEIDVDSIKHCEERLPLK